MNTEKWIDRHILEKNIPAFPILLLGAVLSMVGLGLAVWIIQGSQLGETGAALPGTSALSPARELTPNDFTLFYYYPEAICSQRYCRSPWNVEDHVESYFGDSVTFALIIVRGNQDVDSLRAPSGESWELYPMLPYNRWLEQSGAGEDASLASWIVLVNGAGEEIFSGREIFSWGEIKAAMA